MTQLDAARRVIVKVGSGLLTEAGTGDVRTAWLDGLVDDIAVLRKAGKQVIAVSSGAVALGRKFMGVGMRPLKLEEKQAAAACGQIALMTAWQESFRRHGASVAQVLITPADTENRRRYLNARNTLAELLQAGVVPVINENDTVATQEMRFGDNDRLAARVAQMVEAEILVLLSDIDGLYTADPGRDSSARFIPEVTAITPDIEAMAGGVRSNTGSGGMVTKIAAAKIALSSGCHMAIAKGNVERPLHALQGGGRATWFLASRSPRSARKDWIAGALASLGAFVVDAGAETALRQGKSLLPAGVRAVEGAFDRGDAVLVKTAEGKEVARGLSAYAAEDARRIIGRKSAEIEEILGFKGRDELIHRDDMVLTGGG